MGDRFDEGMRRHENAPRGLSTIAAIVAAVVAVALAFILYRLVGFPENLPLALGAAILVAEIADVAFSGGTFGLRRIAAALVHGIIIAGACWLGVWVARALGWGV